MSEYHAKGGRNATAALTPEERARRNRKAARTLGKAGRKARAAKGWETRRAKPKPACFCGGAMGDIPGVESAHTPNACSYVRHVFDASTAERPATVTAKPNGSPLGHIVPIDDAANKIEAQSPIAPSPRAPLPKASRNAHLEASHRGCVEALGITKPPRALPKAGTVNALVLAAMSIKPMTAEQVYERADGIPAGSFDRVRNALSSLRSGGHVVSEPKPGSAKEKLWRLA